MKDGHLLKVNSTLRNTLNNARTIQSGEKPIRKEMRKRNSLIDYVPGGRSGEYTGGFRLVDMSETVKEKDEEGNEIEKVIPKLGVLGISGESGGAYGTLYYRVGNAIYYTSGQIFDCSDLPINTRLHILAYWNGISFGVITTKKDGLSELTDYGQFVHIGSYLISDNGTVGSIIQIFNGAEVSFSFNQPFLAVIGDYTDPSIGLEATLFAYPTPDNLAGEKTFSGTVFLSESCLGVQVLATNGTYITVHPVATRVLEAEGEV